MTNKILVFVFIVFIQLFLIFAQPAVVLADEATTLLDLQQNSGTPVLNDSDREAALNNAFKKAEEILSGKGLPEKIDIPQKQTATINVAGISRYLVSGEKIITVSKISDTELAITADAIGFTILHIWHIAGRSTIKIQVLPQELPKDIKKSKYNDEEHADAFKFHYYLNHRTFYSGPQYNMLDRSTLNATQVFGITGATPYGNLDTFGTLRKYNQDEEWVNYTLGMTDSKIEPFDRVNMRFFDTSASLGNLILPEAQIQGARFDIFSSDSEYTMLWGQEKSGIFGALTPASEENLDSYIYGLRSKYNFPEEGSIAFSYAGGSGADRSHLGENINDQAVSVQTRYFTEDYLMDNEVAFDGEEFAVLFGNTFKSDVSSFGIRYRDIDRDYYTIMGRPNNQGEKGVKLDHSYYPAQNFILNSGADIYKDRLFPNPDKPNSLNKSYFTRSSYIANDTLSFDAELALNDEQGKISPAKSDSASFQVNKIIPWEQRLGTYLRLERYNYTNINSSLLDYTSNKLLLGAYAQVFPDLTLGVNQEWDRVLEKEAGITTYPRSFLATADYRKKFQDSPYSTAFRIRYRNEDNVTSARSFMLGEDSLRGQIELNYHPHQDWLAYITGSWEKIMGERDSNPSRTEAEIIMGASVVYDTLFSWDPQAQVEGVVFKDLNGNGVCDHDEKGVRDVKIWLGKRSQTSDEYGRFNFGKIRAKRAHVSVDAATLPRGFIMTTPMTQTVEILEGGRHIIRFGVLGVSEVRGFVVNDINLNGARDLQDQGMEKAVVLLDDTKKTLTDKDGYFYFQNVSAGEHKIMLDIKSLPLNFIPSVPVESQIKLFEGMTYSLDFPVRALRTVSGRVFVDLNNNNEYDAQDTAVSHVKITIGNAQVLTNEQGEFIFKNLPAGEFIIEVDKTTLQSGVSLLKDRRIIKLPVNTINVTSEDFILRRD